MKFFQKTSVAVIFTVLMIAAALFIGLSPALKSEPVPEPMAQTTAQEQTASQTPAAEQTSNTAGDETISDKYIRDDAGLFTRSGENAIQDYNTKIYHKTGSHIAILTTDSTGGKTLESYTNSAFDSMGLSEYDMLFAIDTSADEWYVTTGMYVADYTDSKLESIFQDGFSAILDSNADDAASDMYKDLYNWCQTSLNGAADMVEYTPAQDTGRGRRKSMIGTILTILIIFWIIKAIFGSGRRGGGSGGFWSGLFLGSLFSNHHHHGPGPGPGPRPGPRPGGFGGGPRPGGGSRGGFGGGRGGFGGGRR